MTITLIKTCYIFEPTMKSMYVYLKRHITAAGIPPSFKFLCNSLALILLPVRLSQRCIHQIKSIITRRVCSLSRLGV